MASLIRENELELAQDEFDKLQENQSVQPWLRVLLVHALCERKDFESILRLVYKLHMEGDLPRPMWLHLLKEATQHGHYHLMEWIWVQHVKPMYIKPDPDTCVKALKLAAKEGKHKVAESIHGILEVLDPEVAKQHEQTRDAAYEKSGLVRDPFLHKRRNLFSLFSDGHQHAYFDPKVALAKVTLVQRRGKRRIEKKIEHKKKLRMRYRLSGRRLSDEQTGYEQSEGLDPWQKDPLLSRRE